jgi:hypothetical protein
MSKSDTNNTCQEPEDPIEEVKEDNIKAAKKQKLAIPKMDRKS